MPRSTTYQIRLVFPLSGLDLSPNSAKVRMGEYAHDIAIVTFASVIAPPAVTGAPVLLSWGTATDFTAMYGYFDHMSIQGNTSVVVCVGASYPMKGGSQAVWTDLTADQVAYQLADSYQLDADIERDPRVFAQIAQAGESDWQLLVRLAQSVGYTCYCHRTQIRFHPRTRDFVALQGRAPVFLKDDIAAFNPVVGNALPSDNSYAARQLSSVDANGESFTTLNTGIPDITAATVGYAPPFGAVTQTVVDSISDALSVLSAQREMSRWYLQADAVVAGNTKVRQAMPVFLGNLPADNQGYWYVLSVEHRIAPLAPTPTSRYTMALRLGRDSTGPSTTAPTLSPETQLLGINPATGVGDLSAPRLINGRWQASRSVAYTPDEDSVPDFVRDRLADA